MTKKYVLTGGPPQENVEVYICAEMARMADQYLQAGNLTVATKIATLIAEKLPEYSIGHDACRRVVYAGYTDDEDEPAPRQTLELAVLMREKGMYGFDRRSERGVRGRIFLDQDEAYETIRTYAMAVAHTLPGSDPRMGYEIADKWYEPWKCGDK